MLQIVPQHRIFLAIKPVDFRKGIDGLNAICRLKLSADPFSGSVFVFRNKIGTALKILIYDGQGFWLCMKRFSKGRLCWWPQSDQETASLSASQLQILLFNGNPTQASIPEDWRRVN